MNAQINPAELVPSVSLEHMAQCRAGIMQRMDQIVDLYIEVQALASAGHIGLPRILLDAGYRKGTTQLEHSADFREACRRQIDATAWQYLMNESGLRTFLDRKARSEWNEQIEKGEIPELTPENIAATFSTIHAQRGDLFERGVIEAFKRLSWDYKTNSPCKFGKRVVYEYFAYPVAGDARWQHIRHEATDMIDDLTRCFYVLDGKPEPDHRNGTWRLTCSATDANLRNFETDYFRLKSFKNGNAHIEFKRLDLIARMNQIIAKHYPGALPKRI